MGTDKSATGGLFAVRGDLLRGDSLFAVLIFAVVAVFMVSLIASVWRNLVYRKDLQEKVGVQKVKVVGGVMARTAEALIAADELSTLRRVLAEAGLEHDLTSCRIVLPDGGVLADAKPTQITTITLPDSWEGQAPPASHEFGGNVAKFIFPLSVPNRGAATLEIAAVIDDRLEAGLAPQTAQMAIGCLALASMLLVHRHARFRLKAIGAIQEILLAAGGKDGHADFSMLELDPSLGREAVAWNKLLGERQSAEIRSAIKQVKEVLHERSETADEMSAAFDVAPYGLLLVDDRLQISRANSVAAVLLRIERERLVGSEVSQVIDDPRVVADIRAATQNLGAKRVAIELEHSGSAAAGVLRLTLCPVSHDDSRSVLVAIEDVTQQRVAQASMNSFLAKAAHELRTPLTNVRLFVEDALEHCERDLAATSKCLNVINDEALRLERTVSEILSVSEIEAGSFGLKRDDVRLDALLQQLQADHEAQARDKQIALDFELPPKLPVLQADRDKIALVLHNLVGNALKYTLEKGRVTVTAAVEKGQLSVGVSDTGIGIDPDEIERVFEKFYRSKDPQANQVKGSGLGLAISREVARLHGGDITVTSEPGKGSTFTFVLPVGEEEL